jgi:hypothetical protein
MSDKRGLQTRGGPRRDARKQAAQNKILVAVAPFLQPSERLLCPPARGTFSPWTAFVSRNGVVRTVVRVAAFPLKLLLVPFWGGVPASFVITDVRSIVMRGRHRTRITSLPHASSSAPLGPDPNQGLPEGESETPQNPERILQADLRSQWPNGSPLCQFTLFVAEYGQLRVRFYEKWVWEGKAIEDALFRHVAERDGEIQEALARPQDLKRNSAAERETKSGDY